MNKAKHPNDQAWFCPVTNCRRRKFKEGGIRTCTPDKAFFRLEDQVEHETEQDYLERNSEKIQAKKAKEIKNSICKYCRKKFSDRSERAKHEKYQKCKYKNFSSPFPKFP